MKKRTKKQTLIDEDVTFSFTKRTYSTNINRALVVCQLENVH